MPLDDGPPRATAAETVPATEAQDDDVGLLLADAVVDPEPVTPPLERRPPAHTYLPERLWPNHTLPPE